MGSSNAKHSLEELIRVERAGQRRYLSTFPISARRLTVNPEISINWLHIQQLTSLANVLQTAVVQVSQLFIVSPTPMVLLSEVMTMFLGTQVRHPAL